MEYDTFVESLLKIRVVWALMG